MKNIGLYGINLNIAANKVKNSKTPAERKFNTSLMNNDAARAVVDKVDFVEKSMQELDGSKLDQDGSKNGSTTVDAKAKKLGTVGRWLQAGNKPLEAITTQAPKASIEPQVKGSLGKDRMNVSVAHSRGEAMTFSKTSSEGKTVYQAGSEVVTMNANGTLSMETLGNNKSGLLGG